MSESVYRRVDCCYLEIPTQPLSERRPPGYIAWNNRKRSIYISRLPRIYLVPSVYNTDAEITFVRLKTGGAEISFRTVKFCTRGGQKLINFHRMYARMVAVVGRRSLLDYRCLHVFLNLKLFIVCWAENPYSILFAGKMFLFSPCSTYSLRKWIYIVLCIIILLNYNRVLSEMCNCEKEKKRKLFNCYY